MQKSIVYLEFQQMYELVSHQLRTQAGVSIAYQELSLVSDNLDEIFMFLLEYATRYSPTPFQFSFEQIRFDLISAFVHGALAKIRELEQTASLDSFIRARTAYNLVLKVLRTVTQYGNPANLDWLPFFLDTIYTPTLKEYMYQLCILLVKAHHWRMHAAEYIYDSSLPAVELTECNLLYENTVEFNEITKLFTIQHPTLETRNLAYYIQCLRLLQTKVELVASDQTYSIEQIQLRFNRLLHCLQQLNISADTVGLDQRLRQYFQSPQ